MKIVTEFEHESKEDRYSYIDKSIKIILEGNSKIVKDIYELIIINLNEKDFEEV